jgi:lycopene beta-cyclase
MLAPAWAIRAFLFLKTRNPAGTSRGLMRDPSGEVQIFDYVLVGGGLQSGLITLAVLDRAPGSRIAVVERDRRLGGNHTWCFHADDVPREVERAIAPIVAHRWPGYEVRFPGHRRRLAAPYAAVTSERFREVVEARLHAAAGCELYLNASASRVGEREVELEDGTRLRGELVVDARGPELGELPAGTGYQIFLGLELSLSRPHPLEIPVLMDATVAQVGGFRFMYALPLAPDRLLLEDTYFANGPELDRDALRERVATYARELGLRVARVAREEAGILPMPWVGGLPAAPAAGEPMRAGYRGGFFHPATGYSFPVAARVAARVAAHPPARVRAELDELVRRHRLQARYCHVLNWLAFRCFTPERRVHVFERFYRLPEATIRRFYALDMKATDKLRILAGRPPRGMSLPWSYGVRAG